MHYPISLFLVLLFSFSSFAQTKKDIAKTPPMGWNTWNYFHCDINETIVKEIADAMVENGMKDAGYEYIVIDDCWQIDRDEAGKIVVDAERFPSGMKALGDYIHERGLKFGIYSDAGKMTCQERPGSLGYEVIDAQTYESWGVDFLKYDWCHNGGKKAWNIYPAMGNALADLDRPIVFSLCTWGFNNPWLWGDKVGHMWRTTMDIEPCFNCWGKPYFCSVLGILDKQAELTEYAGPGGWNDPDMLQVGNGRLTMEQNRSHFALWAMLAAPLMAGNDLRNMDPEVLEILTNKELISINQDSLGRQAYRKTRKRNMEVWVKPLQGGDYAVCFLNRGKRTKKHSVLLSDYLELDAVMQVRDVWAKEDLGGTDKVLKLEMKGHGTAVLLIRN